MESLKNDLIYISDSNVDVSFPELITNTYNNLLEPTNDFVDNTELCIELYQLYIKMHFGYGDNKNILWWRQIFQEAKQIKMSLENNEAVKSLSTHEMAVNIYIVKLCLFAIWLRMFLLSL